MKIFKYTKLMRTYASCHICPPNHVGVANHLEFVHLGNVWLCDKHLTQFKAEVAAINAIQGKVGQLHRLTKDRKGEGK